MDIRQKSTFSSTGFFFRLFIIMLLVCSCRLQQDSEETTGEFQNRIRQLQTNLEALQLQRKADSVTIAQKELELLKINGRKVDEYMEFYQFDSLTLAELAFHINNLSKIYSLLDLKARFGSSYYSLEIQATGPLCGTGRDSVFITRDYRYRDGRSEMLTHTTSTRVKYGGGCAGTGFEVAYYAEQEDFRVLSAAKNGKTIVFREPPFDKVMTEEEKAALALATESYTKLRSELKEKYPALVKTIFAPINGVPSREESAAAEADSLSG